jgi:hemolysin activation/secretion protein
MVSNEFRFPGGSVSALLGHDIGDRLQPFLFLDYAAVTARRAVGETPVDGTLTSVGPGIRIEIDRYATVGFDAGQQIRSGKTYPAQFLDVSLLLRY